MSKEWIKVYTKENVWEINKPKELLLLMPLK